MASQPPLRSPQLAVDVEDSTPKKIAQNLSERLPFGKIGEMGGQNILNIIRVRRHDGAPGAEAADDDGGGGGARQQLSVPIQQPVAVAVEGEQAANEGIRRRR